MTRDRATRLAHEELIKHGLKDWGVRLNSQTDLRYVGLCSHKDKCIILSAAAVELHPEPEVLNTIRHEIAHALTPGNGHNEIWASKAKEIGCDHISTHCAMGLPPDVVAALRDGSDIEVEFDTQVVRTAKYKVTRLQDKCPHCGKVAKTVKESRVDTKGETEPDLMFITLECGHMLIKKLPKGTPFHLFQSGGDESCAHEWNKNACVKCNRFRPFPYQIEGMRFGEQALAINQGVAILDEMGLGKTQQALGLIKYHPELWPVLYVVKSGIKFQWFHAIIGWMGMEHVAQVVRNSTDIIIPGLKAYIISYDMLVMKQRKGKNGKIINIGFDPEKIIKSDIKTIVLDECQQIKNPSSSRTQAVRRICKGRKVIALSGTPWKNKGGELYSMFNMIAPMKFPTEQNFLDRWVEFYWSGKFRKQGGIQNPTRFREYIKDIAIRRERSEVMPELPTTQRTKLNVQMTADEDTMYNDAVKDFVTWYIDAVANEEANAFNILGKISRLRHITGVAKIPATMDYVSEFIEDTEKKIVIFVHHKDVAASLYQQCKEKFEEGKKKSDEDDENGNSEKIPVMSLSSDLSPEQRYDLQVKFNAAPRAILIASTLASGEGLNLQTCADCVMHERQWNPANEEQAEGRFCRIGQTAPEINAVYSQVVGSIDDHLDEIVERKRRQFHAAMNKGEASVWSQDDIIKELADVIVKNYKAKN